jgi:hypothetical protein
MAEILQRLTLEQCAFIDSSLLALTKELEETRYRKGKKKSRGDW